MLICELNEVSPTCICVFVLVLGQQVGLSHSTYKRVCKHITTYL